MKAHLEISFFLVLFFAATSAVPQEVRIVQEELIQDDLGNVTDEFQEHFFEALKQKAIENHEKAIASLTKCLVIDPHPVVYFELGKNYQAINHFQEAAVYLEKAREAEPLNEAVLLELYNSYYQDNQFDKALVVGENLQKLDPLFSEELVNLYILDEQFEKALSVLDSLDSKLGESTHRERLRRQIYAQTGDTDGQVLELQRKIVENPEDERNYLDLVVIHSQAGNREKALEAAESLLERNPDSELVHLALYRFYLEDQDLEKALNSIKVVFDSGGIEEEAKFQVLSDLLLFLENDPDQSGELMKVVEDFSEKQAKPKVYELLGNFFLQRSNKEKALEFFEKGLNAENPDYQVLVKIALLQLDFGKFEEAKSLSGSAIENYPSQPLLYLIHGTVLNKTGAFSEAVEILTFGLDFIIDDRLMQADFYVQLSVAHKGLNNEDKASEYELKATKLKTEDVNE